MFSNIITGFGAVLSLETLGFAFLGVLIGTLTGILPGIGPITAIALLIPLSYGLEPVNGLIMLIGIYYGSMYGGSTTAILIKTPGEVASIVTTLDGYEMAKQGKAGRALSAAAIGSFIAGTFATLGLMLLAPVLAKAAYFFGSAEYFLLIVLAMTMVSSLTTGSALKAYISTLFGLSIAMVGIDLQTSVPRFTFGIPNLLDGIDFVLIAIALFAIPEAIETMARKGNSPKMDLQNFKGSLWMTRDDWKRSIGPFGRGSVLGFIIGVLPGIGPSLASFLSYGMEKKLSKHPEEFGKGAIEGVAGPEAANNAGVGGALVPLFTLGIPGSATTALLMFIFMMYGLQPGPGMFDSNPTLLWAIIASMYIGNVLLLILNLPLVGVFASLLKLPAIPLFVGVIAFSVLGVYGINFNQFDLILLFGFGLIGYGMTRFGFPLAPAVMALVMGPLLEQNFRRSMEITNGDLLTFVQRPISLVLTIIILLMVIFPIINKLIQKKKNNKKSDDTPTETNI
ncbi:tripartite tricarboxylate transporter permease [Ureibacillus sp. NPDC094379]